MRFVYALIKSTAWPLITVLTVVPLCSAAKLTISPSSPKQLSNSRLQFTATFGNAKEPHTEWGLFTSSEIR
jgi:hypothetical protein